MKKIRIFLLFSGLVLIFVFLYNYYNTLFYKKKFNFSTIKIKEGDNAHKLKAFFINHGVLRNNLDLYLYKVYIKINPPILKTGVYEIPQNITIDSLFKYIERGKVKLIKVTIPEGARSEEIAYIFKKKLGLSYNKFMKIVLDSNSVYKFKIGFGKNLRGFLMPETYYFPLDATEEDVIKKMTQEFVKYVNKISKNSPMIKKYSIYDIIILASIIEKEAVVDKERPIIAGVFYNRLKKGMLLQADPTVRFATGNFKKPITKKDLRFNSPYNTYVTKGLPPTPICNPGKKSIYAAFYPAKVDYLFFVAKFDGSGEHFFSKSNKEHNKYRIIAKRNLDSLRIHKIHR